MRQEPFSAPLRGNCFDYDRDPADVQLHDLGQHHHDGQRSLLSVVGVNLTGTSSTAFSGELDIEGTLNGNYDSQITLPTGSGTPTISSLTPNTGAVGSSIVIAGTNFRSSQLGSTVKFNGTSATNYYKLGADQYHGHGARRGDHR